MHSRREETADRLLIVREQRRICDTCGQPIDSEGAHTTFTPTKHGVEVSWTCVYCLGAEPDGRDEHHRADMGDDEPAEDF